MSEHKMLELILSNQEEMKADLKETKDEVKKINSRVSKLENDRASKSSVGELKDRVAKVEINESWRAKHYGWFTNSVASVVLIGAGYFLKYAIDTWL